MFGVARTATIPVRSMSSAKVEGIDSICTVRPLFWTGRNAVEQVEQARRGATETILWPQTTAYRRSAGTHRFPAFLIGRVPDRP